MTQRRRRFSQETWLLLTMLGCGIAALIFSIIAAIAAPTVILPAIALTNPTTPRVPIIPTITFTPTRTPTITSTPIVPSTITPTPTATNTATRTTTPTPTPLLSVRGTWYHNFGEMNMEQSGTSVRGKFLDGFSSASEAFEGNISGVTLVAKTQSGSFAIKFGEKANTFDGTWSSAKNNFKAVNFCGARAGVAFPEGCSFAGAWINNVSNNSKCDMNLKRVDLQVSGSYCNGTVDGTISYDSKSDETVLAGTWRSGFLFTAQGSIRFFMPGYDALQFVGNYNNSSEWCGWRAQFKQPAPCYRGPIVQ